MDKIQKKNKILIVIGTLTSGGAERVVSILSKALVNSMFDVEILMYYDKPIWYEIDNRINITIVENNVEKKSKIFRILWMRKYIKNSDFDIVLSFLAPFNILTIASLIGLRIPIIVADRNDPRHVPNKIYMRILRNVLYRFATRVVTQTQNNKDYFSKTIRKKCVVIHNPVFIKDKINKVINTKREKEIVTIGRLEEQKNQKLLINAFEIVIKTHPDYKLIIYGEGSKHYELNQYIKDRNLQKKVNLAGARQDVLDCIKNSELFVLSSNYEGMPNALIEAMCLGLPVISTKVSGAIDLIRSGENGLLIDINDKHSLANMINILLERKHYAAEMGTKAMEVTQILNVDNIIKQWTDLIKQSIVQIIN